MKRILPPVLAFCVILAVAAFPLMADNYDYHCYDYTYYSGSYDYYDSYGYSYEGFEPRWAPPDTLINNAYIYVAGNFAEVYYRQYHRPVYGTVAGTGSSVRGTLVSHANFAGTWSFANQTFPIGDGVRGGFYARPNGNANNMHNGFTFLEINVAELAANLDGVDVTIAFSNQSNGNLPNAAWNTPVLDGTYSYNVRVDGGQVIVTVNGFDNGSWGVTMTNNLANWGNNPNSNIRHQRNASVNLGAASGTVFVFFHGQNLTFSAYNNTNTVIGCEYCHSVQADRCVYVGYVCHMVVILNAYGYEIYSGGFGSTQIPLPGYIAEGQHGFTVKLVVNNMVAATQYVVVEVVSIPGYRVATVICNDAIDFGRIIAGDAANTIICNWC